MLSSASQSKRKADSIEDPTIIKKAKNLEAVKKYHANLSGYKKVEVQVKVKFAKKKSTALGRLKTSDQFKNATSEDQATLLSEHQRVYSNEKLQEELDRAKTSWEKEHGNIPEDRSKWSSIEQYFGKRFNANDDFDPLKSAFITAVGPIPEDPLPNETDEEREARETLLLSRDATIRMLERLEVEAKKGKGGEDKEEEDDDESIAMADLGEGEEEEDDVLESDIGEDEEDDIPFQVNEEPKDMKKWK